MRPHDIVTTFHERTSILPQAQIDKLLAADVPVDALAFDPGDYGFCLGTGCVSFAERHFIFEAEMRQPDEICEPAFVVIARNEFGEPADLVAWRGDRLASWAARVSMLGANNLFAPRLLSDALLVEPDVLSWLRSGRRGVVIIDAEKARWQLASADR